MLEDPSNNVVKGCGKHSHFYLKAAIVLRVSVRKKREILE